MTCVAAGSAHVVPAVVGLEVQATRLRRRRASAVRTAPEEAPVAVRADGR